MLQDEEYGSDSSDEDYVPNATEGNESADEVSGDEEVNDEADKTKSGNKNKRKPKVKKGNPLLSQIEQPVIEDKLDEEDDAKEETKKKEDDLWSSFLADVEEDKKEPTPVLVNEKPKAKSWAELLGKKKPKPTVPQKTTECASNPVTPKQPSVSEKEEKIPETVKITKIFEFAGEEVKVEEEVAANSSEAKAAQEPKNNSVAGGTKRRHISGLIGSLGQKRQKLSTLEKTKLDWNSYKKKEGLSEELLLHTKSKDTYIDKQEFLQRADHRQFELERDVRQGVRRSNR